MGDDTYAKKIVEPLVRLSDCRYIVSGIVSVTLNTTLISTLNYGNGECDDVASLTNSDGETVDVDLVKCKKKEKQTRKNS